MYGGNDNVELLQYSFVSIEIAIGRDFYFRAGQETKGLREFGIELPDCGDLLFQLLRRQPSPGL